MLDCRTQQSWLAVCDPAETQRLRRQALGTAGGRRYVVCGRHQRQIACADQPRLCAKGCGQGPYRSGKPGHDGRFDLEAVVADKHTAVIARSESDEAIQSTVSFGLLRGACHRARIRATRWLAMTIQKLRDTSCSANLGQDRVQR